MNKKLDKTIDITNIAQGKKVILKEIDCLQKKYDRNVKLKKYVNCIRFMRQIIFYTNQYNKISNKQVSALNTIIESEGKI